LSPVNRSRLGSRVVEFMNVPIRTCIGCGGRKAKADLIRLGVDDEGNLTLDGNGKKAGRGSYLCHDAKCIRTVRRSSRLARIYGRPISDLFFKELENLAVNSDRESCNG